MEFWLSWQNNKERLQLPVPPESFEIRQGSLNTTVNINNIGEINLIGKSALAIIDISSFFPVSEYSFVQYRDFPKPYECVDMIENWRKSGKPIRLIITDSNINLPCAIENFSYSEKDGTGDVYFTLNLKEYRFLNVTNQQNNNGYIQDNKRPVDKEIAKEYIVKAGDTLYMIAKKLTGNGENYKTLAQKNNIKNPNIIHPGQKLMV